MNRASGLALRCGYWGVGGAYDYSGPVDPNKSYGRLWETKTTRSGFVPQHVQHTWDAGGNLTQRYNVTDSETENFQYDFLDRLTGVSGAYSESYSYNQIGNLVSKGGKSYDYTYTPGKPHAVKRVTEGGNTTTYTYDNNGNMETRVQSGVTRNLTWDAENRLSSVAEGGNTTSVV